MPFSYTPGSEVTREAIEKIGEKLDRQNDLLEKLIKAVKEKK